jgi:UDP-glucose 4-epimerase
MTPVASTVLITGGLGYVGGRIATWLTAATPHISLRLMTRRSTDLIPLWAKSLHIVRGDLLEEQSLKAAVGGVDTIIHLAAINELESQRNPDLALDVNGQGTYRLLRVCRDQGVKRFIYFSTFHVYGPWAQYPITEETPTRPIHPYAITHRLAEDYVNWYRHAFGMETLILRLSNSYGYPADPQVQRWSLVFNDFCLQGVQKGEIKLRSRGTQQRDFIALSDVARGVQHLLGLSSAQWGDGLFNLGGECSLSILQVAQRVARELSHQYGRETLVTPGEAEDSGPTGPVIYSIAKLRRTGFKPMGDMSEEIRGTLAVCEQRHRSGEAAK